MAKEYYVKSNGSLSETSRPKIKVFDSNEEIYDALENGDLNTGEIVSSKFTEGAVDLAGATNLIADQVALINEKIPADAGTTNLLVTQSIVDDITATLDEDRTDTNKCLSRSTILDLIYTIMDANEPIGTIKLANIESGWDSHWQVCDGTNGTPDLREAVPVGIGTSDRSEIATHDTYTLGQFKDDQMQTHTHSVRYGGNDDWGNAARINGGWTDFNSVSSAPTGRVGATTHGKQVGLNFIMKISNYGD